MRGDILFWALSRDNCKRYWLEHDAPVVCDLPLLPEAGGGALWNQRLRVKRIISMRLRLQLRRATPSSGPALSVSARLGRSTWPASVTHAVTSTRSFGRIGQMPSLFPACAEQRHYL
eukprot:2439717-Pyramimonas_sp.AAC.1